VSTFEIRKAERRNVCARVAFIGPSGAGKTYSSVHYARGLVGPEGNVVVIDTEQGSSEMYSDKAGGFSVLTLDAPYSPKRYMDAIDVVEKMWDEGQVPLKQRVLIVDQITHAWAGEGGVLDYVDSQAGTSKNSFAAWKKGTPIQQAFIERLLRVEGHLIVTMRSKTEWVLEKDSNGKTVPRKIGLAPVQRNDIEFEWQVVFDIEQDSNQARATKDRTSLYAGRVFQPSEEHGKKLADFLAAGKPLADPAPPAPKGEELLAPEQVAALVNAAKVAGRGKEEFLNVVEKAAGTRNPKEVKASQYTAVLEALSAPKNTSALDNLA